MGIRHIYGAFLADLVREHRAETLEWWKAHLARKIEDMKAAMRERFVPVQKKKRSIPHNDGPEHYCKECLP